MITRMLAAAGALLLAGGAANAQTAPTLTLERADHLQGRTRHDAGSAQGNRLLSRGIFRPLPRRHHSRGQPRRAGRLPGARRLYAVAGRYLFAVIDRAIVAEMPNLPKR
jgi:hypothetical protein